MRKISIYIFMALIMPLLLTGCQQDYNSVDDFYNKMHLKKNSYHDLSFLLKVKIGNIKTQSQVYLSGDNSRIESSLDGGKTYSTVSIKNDGISYIFVPSAQTAYQVPQDNDAKLEALDWKGDFSGFSFGKRKTLEGENCLEVVNYLKDNETYYCISEKYGIPIMSTVSMDKDYKMESSISDIKTSKISKKMFEVPKGAKVVIQGK